MKYKITIARTQNGVLYEPISTKIVESQRAPVVGEGSRTLTTNPITTEIIKVEPLHEDDTSK